MKNLHYITICLFSSMIILHSCSSNNENDFKYKNPKLPVDARVNDLLKRMTIEEKIGQLTCMLGWEMYEKISDSVYVSQKFKNALNEKNVGMLWATLRADPWTQKTLINGLNPELAAKAINEIQRYAIENSRLGIPIFIAEECPHGHMAIGTTVFPTSIGQASTWNPDIIEEMASAIAEEVRLQGAHIGYGPVLDLAREPRWSRVEETYGEDPILIAEMGKAVVKGFQGYDFKSKKNVISTPKHLIGYGNSEGGHNGGIANIGNRDLLQNYCYPFQEVVSVGVKSMMSAYNSIDGVPCTSNQYIFNDILRNEWNFSGFTVSDLGSIEGIHSTHCIAKSIQEASVMAIRAGIDIDLGGNAYSSSLANAIKNKELDEAELNTAVSRVLRMKFEMGLFEDPYVEPEVAKRNVRSRHNKKIARQVARESIILLKNENQLLPLSKNTRNIAVIGPNADNIYNQLGDYTAPQEEDNIITVLKGIKSKSSENITINYVKGCAIRDTLNHEIDKAVYAAKNADVAIVVLGGSSARDFKTEYIETGAATISDSDTNEAISDMESGEGFDRENLFLMGKQLELLQTIKATGTPIVLVLIQGRPLNINWASENIPAIINAWYPGQEGGTAIADVIFGDYNPAGRLPISIPRSTGQLPVYYNHNRPKRHNYVEMDSKPIYAFGHGLSYTDFEYSCLNITQIDDKIIVEFNLKNIGNVDGDEVVQLYINQKYSSVVTPIKQLKKFKRVNLKKGESTKIQFELSKADFSIYNNSMQKITESGVYGILIGKSSENIQLSEDFHYQM
jgi:beta-glucosidase